MTLSNFEHLSQDNLNNFALGGCLCVSVHVCVCVCVFKFKHSKLTEVPTGTVECPSHLRIVGMPP